VLLFFLATSSGLRVGGESGGRVRAVRTAVCGVAATELGGSGLAITDEAVARSRATESMAGSQVNTLYWCECKRPKTPTPEHVRNSCIGYASLCWPPLIATAFSIASQALFQSTKSPASKMTLKQVPQSAEAA